MRIAVLGDSISSRNNGAASHSWPELLESLIRSLGVFDVEVRNYALPGLTYKTALNPTPGWLIGGYLSPVQAINRDGCDLLLVCLGVNDRNNPTATQDALAFVAALPAIRTIHVRQYMYDFTGVNDSIVTQDEQWRMDQVYTAIGGEQTTVNLGRLYDMGYSYDTLHPTDSGKQWIASSVYMYLQQHFPLTPISRNIAWLHSQSSNVREIMKQAQS